jgi:hypothetical protein
VKETVVKECEAPPPGRAFTAALKTSSNHIVSSPVLRVHRGILRVGATFRGRCLA